MKRFFSMRLLGVMAIAAIALSNVFLAACSEDDDIEMNSSILAKGLMTRAVEGPEYKGVFCLQGKDYITENVSFGNDLIPIKYTVSWREGNFPMQLFPKTEVEIDDPDYNDKYSITYKDLFNPRWEGCTSCIRFHIKGYIKTGSDSIVLDKWDGITVDIDKFKMSDENDND